MIIAHHMAGSRKKKGGQRPPLSYQKPTTRARTSALRRGHSSTDRMAFLEEWGIDPQLRHPGGLNPHGPQPVKTPRDIYLLQRKGGKIGAGLSKTTGWIHRAHLKQKAVTMLNAVNYERIDDQGLHIMRREKKMVLSVDTVVICAGQESERTLADALAESGLPVYVIGGADVAVELDAKRAIDQGARLAVEL